MMCAPTISVEGIELQGRCGVSAEERMVGQTLVIDVRCVPVSCPGAVSDDIAGTVNYARIVDIVQAIVLGAEFHLLERLASVLVDAMWDEFELVSVEVAVTKPGPPVSIPVRAARVEVVRTA